jgi:hypothetical protein
MIHIYKIQKQKLYILAVVKSINIGAGEGNFYEKLLGYAPEMRVQVLIVYRCVKN